MHCPKIDKDDEKNKAIARNYYKLGLSFQKQGDPRKFIEAYECVLTLVPYSVTARYKLAEALDFAGQYSRAITQYTMYLAVSKDQALKEKVKARIEAIRNLTDKALPPDENATKDELEQSKAAVKKRFDTELQNKLAELKAATKRTEDYEKKRQALLEEYRKKEKTRLDELEIRIKRLDALEKLSQKNKVLIKYIKTGPSHRTEHSTLRKWGMGTTAFGLLVGLAAVGTYFYKMQLTDEVSSTSTQEKKDYNSDLSDVNKGYSKTDVLYWEDSKARSPYMTVDMLGMLSNGLGIFAGVVVITGTVLFFMGESRKVKVDYNADIKGDEPSKGITYSFTPMLTQGGGGISFETRW
ncbi:hypothetical protein KJ865_07310 [Myxococcota bacterium]|nr:hypothetical protein [Myxococcota bacterium]